MMNFFLVDSPLQLLNAIEAKKHFGIKKKNSSLIVLEGVSLKNFTQIQTLIKEDEWCDIFLLPKNKWKILRYKSLFRLNRIANRQVKVNKIFIGDYRSNLMRHFANSCNYEECYLLDDGNASVFIHKKINTGIGVKNSLNMIRKVAHLITDLKDDDIFDIKYFTVYANNRNDRVVKNNYNYIKSMIADYERSKSIYFLGTCLPELKIIDYKSYLENLKKVKEYYVGSKLYYIPHRREDEKKINKIERELGLDILDFETPIEWAIVQAKALPEEIASFYTSALDSCFEIYGDNVLIRSFKPQRNQIAEDVREKFDLIFEGYRKYNQGFHIVDI